VVAFGAIATAVVVAGAAPAGAAPPTSGGTITGRVTVAGGGPAAGICAQVRNGPGAVTDDQGDYRIEGVPAGPQAVGFRDCNDQPRLRKQWWNSADSENDATPVEVADGGAVAGIDATLEPGAVFSGRITDGQGRPLQGVGVLAAPWPDDRFDSWATTDADGNYRSEPLAPGRYRVAFLDANPTIRWATQWWPGASRHDDGQALDLSGAPADHPGVDVVMRRAGIVSGTVTARGGGPAAGVCVTALTAGGYADSTNSGPDGTYRLERLAAGTYTIAFEDCDRRGPWAPQVYDDASWDAPTPVHVAAGAETAHVDASLVRAAVVRGTVRDEGGRPIEGACVSVVGDAAVGGGGSSGPDGAYEVLVSQPGTYRLQFVDCNERPAFAGRYWGGAATSAGAPTVTVHPGDVLTGYDVTLPGGGAARIRGRVVNAQGVPMTTACVIAYVPTEGGRAVPVGSDGSYELLVGAGTYYLAFFDCESGGRVTDPVTHQPAYPSVWWAGHPVVGVQGADGPDPIVAGAQSVTVAPGTVRGGMDWCFGCALTVTGVRSEGTSLVVDFTGYAAAFESAAASGGAAATTSSTISYRVTCTSSDGGAEATADGSTSPITVAGATAGATYSCVVQALSGGVPIGSSAPSTAVAVADPPSSGGTDPFVVPASAGTATPGSAGPTTTTGAMARTGVPVLPAAALGLGLVGLGLLVAAVGRDRDSLTRES
jgi:hypothetical protein